MSVLKYTISLLALFAILNLALSQSSQGGPHSDQGGPHQDQGRAKRQAVQDGAYSNQGSNVSWTTCDYLVTPKLSCQDCNSRLICLPIAGKVIPCGVNQPYCNNGLCSTIPSAGCE